MRSIRPRTLSALRAVSAVFLIGAVFGTAALAAPPDSMQTAAQLRAHVLYAAHLPVAEGSVVTASTRSVPLAFALSALVPGAGQAYNRHWVKAAVGAATEIALIASYVSFRNRGIDAEHAYEKYAHAYWDPGRYAGWLLDFAEWLPDVESSLIQVPDGIDFQHPDTWSAEQRARVRAFFGQIRSLESRLYHPETGATFSHKLPYFGEQQYYELIGKYFQFAPGWDDYPAWRDAEGQFTDAIDPELTGPGGSKPNVQGRFVDYARDHGRANDLLRVASRVSAFVVVNHLLAAIDAAVFAKLHNDRLSTSLTVGQGLDGEFRPQAALHVRL
jgi:hypothetical protein